VTTEERPVSELIMSMFRRIHQRLSELEDGQRRINERLAALEEQHPKGGV